MNHTGRFKAEDLVPVPRKCCPHQPVGGPFAIGDFVHLNSGSPNLTVVDFDHQTATVAWKEKGEVKEMTSPFNCYHRAV